MLSCIGMASCLFGFADVIVFVVAVVDGRLQYLVSAITCQLSFYCSLQQNIGQWHGCR